MPGKKHSGEQLSERKLSFDEIYSGLIFETNRKWQDDNSFGQRFREKFFSILEKNEISACPLSIFSGFLLFGRKEYYERRVFQTKRV